MANRTISAAGIALIKRFEGCRLTAYKCSAGVWTIGYGHTSGVHSGQAITQAQLTGDIEAANALANLYKEIAAKRYENTQNIVSANQWGQQFGLSQAEQTGTYNGAATLAAQQLEMQKQQVQQELEAGKIDMETARKQIEYISAQIANLQADTTGKNLQNRYYQTQLGG